MPRVNFTDFDKRHEVEVKNGTSLMEAALENDVLGIVAQCGGVCSCATCHAYIDPKWLEKCPEMSKLENFMLDNVYDDRKDNSRLTCQIMMTDELDGIELEIADNV